MPASTISPALIDELKQQLKAQELALLADAKAHHDQLEEPLAATNNTFVAGTEGAIADSEDERVFALLQHVEQELHAVRGALQRIAIGEYGYCGNCGMPIGEARLRAIPHAALCIACQREAEAN